MAVVCTHGGDTRTHSATTELPARREGAEARRQLRRGQAQNALAAGGPLLLVRKVACVLTTCTECGHMHSTMAQACPGCGHPVHVKPEDEVPADLRSMLEALARDDETSLEAVLHSLTSNMSIGQTNATLHCLNICLDANGRDRTRALASTIARSVINYVIPRSRFRRALALAQSTGSSHEIWALAAEAKSVFSNSRTTGEAGELLVFYLAEKLLRIPQILCKMQFKTNRNVHVHGADGLHAGYDPKSGNLHLYFCESKLVAERTQSVLDCLRSIAPFVLARDSSLGPSREFQLLSTNLDLDNPATEQMVKSFLDPGRSESNSVEYRAICLAGFDSPHYCAEATHLKVCTALATEQTTWVKHISDRLFAERLSNTGMHLICIAMPSVQAFRDAFLDEIGVANVAE